MSSDIVERCRAAGRDERLSTGALYLEAADEIERLRAELATAKRDALEAKQDVRDLLQIKDDNTRLRAELADTTDILTESVLKETNKREAAEAERDRLLELLREANLWLRWHDIAPGIRKLIDAALAKEKKE